MKSYVLAVLGLLLTPIVAPAADLSVSYTVDARSLGAAISGTDLMFELFTDPACTVLTHTDIVKIDDVSFISRLTLFKPKGGMKPTKTAEIRQALVNVLIDAPLYLKVTGIGVVPLGGACQVQPSGIPGPAGPVGPAGPQGAGICTPNYVDNGDGTVTESCTGLSWERKRNRDGVTNYADVHDADNTYTWTAIGDGDLTNPDGTAFSSFLSELNTPPCFASHCDWRLPSASELRHLLPEPFPCTVAFPCIPPELGPTGEFRYWSGSTRLGNEPTAWFVDFSYGDINDFPKTSDNRVRAVRGGF